MFILCTDTNALEKVACCVAIFCTYFVFIMSWLLRLHHVNNTGTMPKKKYLHISRAYTSSKNSVNTDLWLGNMLDTPMNMLDIPSRIL